MQRTQLPPKRWESAEDSRFDGIRHFKWFVRLQKRKHHIPMLEQAYQQWFQIGEYSSQKQICENWGVSPREFRDYCAFKTRDPALHFVSRTEQAIIDESYARYCLESGAESFTFQIKQSAITFGRESRPMIEAWETNPNLYPTGYTP